VIGSKGGVRAVVERKWKEGGGGNGEKRRSIREKRGGRGEGRRGRGRGATRRVSY